ncbi:MAG TPA: Ni/Fe-hydrogenase, b-type cytochrome subunit [Phycicoccus sp.]|nr:Ni/Fe-hydrogenase, b-type cytochrome subunit [Phycicoccus sp.]
MTQTLPAPATLPGAVTDEAAVAVLGTLPLGRLSSTRLLMLAGAAPPDTEDVVELALADATQRAGQQPYAVAADAQDPARPDRRYSLSKVSAVPTFPGETPKGTADLVIMRGDLDAVLTAAQASRETRALLRRNAAFVRMRGGRALGVATAQVHADGTPGKFTMRGFVSLRQGLSSEPATEPEAWVRVNVWSAMLRTMHWANVAAIVLLSVTGYFIMDPFFGPANHAGVQTGYLMGWMRLVHFIAAFAWIAVGLVRVSLLFLSRNRYLRWPALWPFHSRKDVGSLVRIVAHYTFLRRHAPLYLAHNPLQQLTYTSVYIGCAAQMATGMVLYSLAQPQHWFWQFWVAPAHWLGIPTIRLIHTLIMMLLWAFVVAHIYLAVRADSVERHGGISSMINGGVWLRRGSKPVDAPEV